jgi:hypothetical protein
MFERIFKDKRATTKVSFAILSVFILLFSIVMIVAESGEGASITTDKEDYAPEETVKISGKGFDNTIPLTVSIIRPTLDGQPGGDVETCSPDSCDLKRNDDSLVFPDGPLEIETDGSFSDYEYLLNGIQGPYTINILDEDSLILASHGFTDTYWGCDDGNSCTENDQWHWEYLGGWSWGWKCYGIQIPDCGLETCGDGEINQLSEVCDNGDNNGQVCVPGYGETCDWCNNQCQIETETGPYCGDSILNGDEKCDGSIGDSICADVGQFNYGELSCTEECVFDTFECGLDIQCPEITVLTPPDTLDITWYSGTIDAAAVVSDYQSGVKEARVIFHNSPIWRDPASPSLGFGMIYNIPQGRWEYSWDSTQAPSDCSIVYADVFGEDNAGNGASNQCVDTNRFGIDNAPPITTKVVGEPSIDKIDGDNYYVKTTTQFTLTATDCGSGVDYIHYEIWWDSDDNGEVDTSLTNTNVYDDEIIFQFTEESIHEIRWYAVDKLGNTEKTHYQEHAVDDTPPTTTEIITGPKYIVEDKTYLDGVTEIELTCTDPEPHPVNQVTLHARYNVDGEEWKEIKTERGYAKFSFPEESQHTLEYYCEDALGNTEQTHSELYYVDHTKPVTTLTLGTPLVESNPDWQGWVKKWITSQTLITLTATDPDTTEMGCNSGVDETKYRVSLVADQYCNSAESGCSYAVGSGEWQNYDGEFTIGETSCHLIEYYSIDNVEKTEAYKRDCVFVDNEAPVFNAKEVGEPKVLGTDGYDWYVTQDTTICVSANDILPHPVGGVEISCNVEQWNTDATQESEPDNEYTAELNENGCFNYEEDSYHKLTCTATDDLGNSATMTEKDIVDTLEPTSNKVVGEPQYDDGESLFVTSTTPITFTCTDQTPHPVANEKLCFKVGYDEPTQWTDVTDLYCGDRERGDDDSDDYCCVDVDDNNQFLFNFNENEDSSHKLEYYCEDGLGNKPAKATIEYDDVDDTPPSIFFVNPTPDFAENVKQCIQSVVVKITDEKSGIDESSIHAVLISNNGEGEVVRNVSLIKQTIGSTVTYQAMMDKELPEGYYQLVVYASDNLGNLGSESRQEILTESVFAFVSDNTCSDLDVEEGGDCEITFNVCMRGGNSIKFWMDKSFSSAISSGIVPPELMNATITDEDDEQEALVGLQEILSGLSEEDCLKGAPEAQWIGGKCWFKSDTGTLPLSCEEINGRTQFTLELSLSSDITTLLGTGVHETTYWLESTDDDSLCPEQPA